MQDLIEGPLTNENVKDYQNWVDGIVRRLLHSKSLPGRYAEDLQSVGLLVLVELSKKYNSSKGVPFKAYAYLRVRGAMIDFLRKYGEKSTCITNGSSRRYECVESNQEISVEARRFWRSLSKLSAERKAIIIDLYMYDSSLASTAKKYKKSRSWVSRQHKKALEQIRYTCGE